MLRLSIALSCFALAMHAAMPVALAAERPNILWISLEDMSADLGCYGDQYAVTPHMDALAREGCRYTQVFTHAGVCAPSRSGIITGMYPTSIGTHYMRCKGVPPAHVKCFTEYLRAAGYYCTNDSKTDYNFDPPLTAWDDSRRGAHWSNRPTPETPFFAVINLTTTHESQIRLPQGQLEARRKTLTADELHDPAQAVLPPYFPDTPIVRRDMANYYDNVTFTDKEVGRILQQLADDGLADNTIVFCWGDHGRGLPRHKRWIYDSGIHVPLIVRWPKTLQSNELQPGSVSDELVAFVDLAPTMLSLAGVKIPSHLQGQAFLGDKKAPPREYVYAARDRMDETLDIIRAVRDKRFKYIRNYRPDLPYAQPITYMDEMPTIQEWRKLAVAGKLAGPQAIFFQPTKPVEELYDTQADPHEVHNLAADPQFAGELTRLRAAHEKWREDTGDLGLIAEADLNEQWRPGGEWAVTAEPTIAVAAGKATIACATEGASIAYRLTDKQRGGQRPQDTRRGWQLYTLPVEIVAGQTIEAQACRLGFKDSQQVTAPGQ
ncbi:MAG: sulfatase [Pirellulaceae bacterium]